MPVADSGGRYFSAKSSWITGFMGGQLDFFGPRFLYEVIIISIMINSKDFNLQY